MDYLKTTDDEEAAERLRRRKHDGFPAEVCAAAVLGAAAAVKINLDYAAPSSDRVEFIRVAIASMCGLVIFGALARMVRTRSPLLLLVAAPFGIFFVALVVVSGPQAPSIADPVSTTATSTSWSVLAVSSLPKQPSSTVSTTVAEELPSATEPEVASAGPVPPGDGAAPSSTEMSSTADTSAAPVDGLATETSLSTQEEQQSEPLTDDPVSCTIDVQGMDIAPTAGCAGRVDVRAFGEPRSGPSAWQLPGSAELLMASLSPEGQWIRVGQEAGTAPGCVFDLEATDAEPTTTEPTTTSADRIRVIELQDAPRGTRITLWAECDPSKEQSFDPTAGWVIEVG